MKNKVVQVVIENQFTGINTTYLTGRWYITLDKYLMLETADISKISGAFINKYFINELFINEINGEYCK